MDEEQKLPAEALALESIYQTNRKAIKTLEEQNQDLILKLIAGFHGVKIGDIVRCVEPGRRYDKVFKIQRFDQKYWNDYQRGRKPWVYGYPLNNDGEFSKKPILIYGAWERIPEVIPNA